MAKKPSCACGHACKPMTGQQQKLPKGVKRKAPPPASLRRPKS